MSEAERVHRAWDRIEAWMRDHAPTALAGLRPPAEASQVAEIERELGLTLPPGLVASLARHDGVASGGGQLAFPGGDRPMSAAEILKDARMARDLWDDGSEDGEQILDGDYWHRQYLMVAAQANVPDGLALDCRPGASFGEVGDHFKGEGTRFGHHGSYAELLTGLADALESGQPAGWPLKYVAVPFDGEMSWESAPKPPTEPVSLFEEAARARTPAPVEPVGGELAPVAEDGWAGEYRSFCLTFVHGVSTGELLHGYGALDGAFTGRTRTEAFEDRGRWTNCFLPIVRAGYAGEWAFGIEEGHQEGLRDEVLRRLSRGTRAVALRHRGATQLSYYEDGRLVTGFDTSRDHLMPGEADPHDIFPGLPGPRRVPAPPLGRPPLGRPLGALIMGLQSAENVRPDLRQVCDAVAAALGIDLAPDALGGALPSARILPLLAPIPGSSGPVGYGMGDRVDGADPGRLRTALIAQAALAAAETGLDRFPEVADALTEARTDPAPAPVADDSPLGIRLRTVVAEARGTHRAQSTDHGRERFRHQDFQDWQDREAVGTALRALRELPALKAAPHVVGRRKDPYWRTRFVADLEGG
ncbi:DUF6461 domain-containing protein [Streptomyces kunmingensis]|uniref:DUF6461 domain-containing protein n=1 Tax=Streptomyces kunmingensis TaxID=68225 RepID=A0ABU6CAQ9_9ACTN|nr:DUF6461 domain-containing protein [Streptomyces kunmingensis]MEB3961281.1 DUF6461 domain-containing protein [Streptomyces kunmingensis]